MTPCNATFCISYSYCEYTPFFSSILFSILSNLSCVSILSSLFSHTYTHNIHLFCCTRIISNSLQEGQEEQEEEDKEASKYPSIDKTSKFKAYNNPLLSQMQTSGFAEPTPIPFQTTSGSAFEPLSNSTNLSLIGSRLATMLSNVDVPNVNINAIDFAPEVAFRASQFDQEMVRFMRLGGLHEPQVYASMKPQLTGFKATSRTLSLQP